MKPTRAVTPPYLRAGDKVGIVCTARKTGRLEIDHAVRKLKSWKLEPVIGNSVGASLNQFAGDDWFRARDVQWMMENPEIRAIFCARGGYGTVRIVDKLTYAPLVKNPKWMIGFSDVTVLHSHIHSQLNIETVHGPMAINFKSSSKDSLNSLRDVLFGKKVSYKVKSHSLNIFGKGKGQLVGGNLSVLYSICGSRSDISTKGKILLLEDLDEYLYHVDRMMMQLKRTNKLRNLAGMIVGGFTKMKDNETPYGMNALEIIHDHAKEYGYPVAFGFPSGHIMDNRAMILGRQVTLDVSAKGSSVNFGTV
jgi:muramoyltetrapeptide carboxypeptidase